MINEKSGFFKRFLFIIFTFTAITVQTLFMQGCNGNMALKEDINIANTNHVEAGTLTNITQSAMKGKVTVSDGVISNPTKDEFSGVVYQGYIYKRLCENEWGWNLRALCETLDANIVIQKDKDDIYKNWDIPVNFYIEKGNVKLVFEGDVDSLDEFYIKNPYMASIRYKVYKDGKDISMKQIPITYRKGGPYVNLKELLDLLEISYCEDAENFYLDSEVPTVIKGKMLFDGCLTLDFANKICCKLVYNYKSSNDPDYRNIELHINDETERVIQLFSESNRGSADYYDGGEVYSISFEGEAFIQVYLSQDTLIYKYRDGQLFHLFGKEKYQKYFKGNFILEGYEDEKCVFTDKLNKISKKFVCDDVRPGTLYNISILSFDRLKQDLKNNRLMLELNAGAVQEGRQIFGFTIEFFYDGEVFVPSKVVSTDWKKFSTDKEDGREIRSMSDYRYFEYDWENKDIEKKAYGLFDGNKTSEVNAKKILNLLPYVEWSRFASIDTDSFFQIMQWLENREYKSTEELAAVMKSTNGLDGAYTEAYCNVLRSLFLKDKKGFIEALSNLDEKQIQLICSFTAYGLSYNDTSDVKKDMEKLLASDDLTQKEKKAAEALRKMIY